MNILTNLAYHKKEITVFEKPTRPNIHIFDMVRNECLLNAKRELVTGKIFNAGDENQTVNHLASQVKKVIGDDVEIKQLELMTIDHIIFHPKKLKRNLVLKL